MEVAADVCDLCRASESTTLHSLAVSVCRDWAWHIAEEQAYRSNVTSPDLFNEAGPAVRQMQQRNRAPVSIYLSCASGECCSQTNTLVQICKCEAWRDRLRRDTAAGHRWTKVHVVRGELSPYEEYEFSWAFTRTTQAGEDVRVLEATDLEGVPDFFVLEHQHVIRSVYDDAGKFVGALEVPEPDAATYRALAARVWADAAPFGQWWDAHPSAHPSRNAA